MDTSTYNPADLVQLMQGWSRAAKDNQYPSIDVSNMLISVCVMLHHLWLEVRDIWPGVWPYDVAEPLGVWLAQRCTVDQDGKIYPEMYEIEAQARVFINRIIGPRYLLNAFSLNMIESPASITVVEVDLATAWRKALKAKSAIGHADTAAVFASVLGIDVTTNREKVTLSKGMSVLVGQYTGPRLPEGATRLPEGATIKWLEVTVTDDSADRPY